MTIQYPSLSLAQEAARLAVRQAVIANQLAAGQPPRLPSPTGAPHVPTLVEPSPAPGCEHLRHLLIGSPEGVRHAIERLHVLQYVEGRLWTPLIAIPAQGIHITPAHGQVLSYLVQQRPIR